MLLAYIQYPDLHPIIFHIGPLAVRWYGVAYMLGFIFGYQVLLRLIRRGYLHTTADQLGDLMTWLIVGVLVGGRAGWVIFYDHNIPGPKPWYQPFAMWDGGMSFHGGLIGVIVVLLIWSRYKQIKFWNLADALALVTPIGLFFGRCANFVNAELVGRPTTLPWGVMFPGHKQPRHPSELYEALLEGPLLMLILWLTRRRLYSHTGATAALFVVGYGIIRFCVEFTRAPDSQLGFIAFGWLTMGQLLSAIMAAIGVGILIWRLRIKSTAPQELQPSVPAVGEQT